MKKAFASLALAFVALAGAMEFASSAESNKIIEATLGDGGKSAEVSTAQVRNILAGNSALLLDTRTKLEFEAGHIPGAVNLDPLTAERVLEIARGDKQRELVLYCNGPYCQASRRAADMLLNAGFTNVRRYQLGMPVWRALGGAVAIGESGVRRIHGKDGTAVIIDVRATSEFRKGTLDGAVNAPAESVVSGAAKLPLPEDDFNRRILLIGNSAEQAKSVADLLGTKPWHNVSYFAGSMNDLLASEGR